MHNKILISADSEPKKFGGKSEILAKFFFILPFLNTLGYTLLKKYNVLHRRFRLELLPFRRGVTYELNEFLTADHSCTTIFFFEKTTIEVCSPQLYASFGTFYAKIGQLFVAQ